MFIGSRIEFDGNEDNGQIAEFANGQQFGIKDIRFVTKQAFKWDILISFEFVNELKFRRFAEERFKTPQLHFNELEDYAEQKAMIAGLSMPEGYKFDRNTWKAKILG